VGGLEPSQGSRSYVPTPDARDASNLTRAPPRATRLTAGAPRSFEMQGNREARGLLLRAAEAFEI
jgi:hypothetical protein